MLLGVTFGLQHMTEMGDQSLYVSFLTTEDGQPIVEEDGDNLIRENL
jgi:hypothetical protein